MDALLSYVDDLEIPSLTKSSLVQMLTDQMGLTGKESCEVVEGFFELIAEQLEKGKDVKLAGFGNFDVLHKAARPGRNPRTGENVQISPRRVVKFSPGPKFMRRMSGRSEARSIAKPDRQIFVKPRRRIPRRSDFSENALQPRP